MSEEIKKTAGQIISDYRKKAPGFEDDIREYTKAMSPSIATDILCLAEHTRRRDLYRNKDFYIVGTKMGDPLLMEPKFKCWARRSCPTPVYNQDVYKFHHQTGIVNHLWSIPMGWRCDLILKHQQHYLNDPNWRDIARTVLLMKSGELLKWIKKENGEKQDAVIFIHSEEEEVCLTM